MWIIRSGRACVFSAVVWQHSHYHLTWEKSPKQPEDASGFGFGRRVIEASAQVLIHGNVSRYSCLLPILLSTPQRVEHMVFTSHRSSNIKIPPFDLREELTLQSVSQPAFNGRCKLDHPCSKEQGLTIKQYKFPKLWLIHNPLDSNPCCYEHEGCTAADSGTRKPQIPANWNLYPDISGAYWIDDPCSWSPSQFCKTANLHNLIINTGNSFNHLLCSDALG